MCGIIGIIGKNDVVPHLLKGLQRLEYRGYDSTGIATLNHNCIERRRAEGKLKNLMEKVERDPISGTTGIGHTRWATHGAPNLKNAHPHMTDRVAIVHNGIIENFKDLRKELLGTGCTLTSDTDTELLVHMITKKLEDGLTPAEAAHQTFNMLNGAFALGLIFSGQENLMIAARQGSPLAIGFGEGEMFLGSDALALAPLTRKIMYLEDGDWAIITSEGSDVFDVSGKKVTREMSHSELSGVNIGKGEYRHFMLKEIFEQPQAIANTLNSYIDPQSRNIHLPLPEIDLSAIKKITLIACGTSYYACLCAKYWIEKITQLSVEVDIASEFRYREPKMPKGGLAFFISQSGETVDTLAALRHARSQNQKVVSIVNVPESAIARESDSVIATKAGPEIGVASTKAFTAQLTALACFAIATALARKTIRKDRANQLIAQLAEVPAKGVEVLNNDQQFLKVARQISDARDVIYLGRGTSFALAMEGALKLKEISYIHAEGYAAGEMKHGPIALIDDSVPVIAIAPSDNLFEKTASNIHEVLARGGKVIFISDSEGHARFGEDNCSKILMPVVSPFVAPILYAIPVQLLAYHVAVIKGTDVDQPRNLAKSVTVE